MSKTATTFLQKFCFSNLDDVHNIFKPNFINDQRLVDIRESLMNKEGHDYKLIKIKSDFNKILQNLSVSKKKILLSEENLTIDSTKTNLIAKRLKDIFPSAKIFFTLREQYSWLISIYYSWLPRDDIRRNSPMSSLTQWLEFQLNQQKLGLNNVIDRVNFYETLICYEKLFGKENVHVVLYEDFIENPEFFFSQISNIVGIPKKQMLNNYFLNSKKNPRKRISYIRAKYFQSRFYPILSDLWSLCPQFLKNYVRPKINKKSANEEVNNKLKDILAIKFSKSNSYLSKKMDRDLSLIGYKY